MSSWAILFVECDECKDKVELEMTELFQYSGKSWDTRNINRKLEQMGWDVNEQSDYHLCDICIAERELEEEEEAKNLLDDFDGGEDESEDN
jgi:hypothetical protein